MLNYIREGDIVVTELDRLGQGQNNFFFKRLQSELVRLLVKKVRHENWEL